MFRLFTLIFLAHSVLLSSSWALKPEKEYPAVPTDYGIIYREAHLTTDDSIQINAWFFPAQDTAGIFNDAVGHFPLPEELKRSSRPYRTLDSLRRPTVIICNGDAGNMAWLIYHAYPLFVNGFNVLTFDWRGFGASQDWPIEPDFLCHTEFLRDYNAVVNYVKQQPEVDSMRIGLFGFSTGAYLSMAVVAARDDIAAFAGRALITSFDEVVPILKQAAPDRPVIIPEDYPMDLQPIIAAEKLRCPVLLIVGENDQRTPPAMSQKVMAALKGPKELWIVPGASHGGANGPEYLHREEFFERLIAFFRKSM